MPRLFIAVWPPDDVAAELTALPRKDQRGVRFVRPENWHITLRFLGDAQVDDVVEALDGVSLAAARAQLGPVVDVLAERVLVVPVGGLDELARIVTRRTRNLGQPPPKRFAAHLTLARVKRRARMPHALGVPFSAAFAVEEVALVQSRLDPDGARYETIATWPLLMTP
jgi:2'-5' RNA ligase